LVGGGLVEGADSEIENGFALHCGISRALVDPRDGEPRAKIN
jgi:hypothetical protein